jgi:hypothetical protein
MVYNTCGKEPAYETHWDSRGDPVLGIAECAVLGAVAAERAVAVVWQDYQNSRSTTLGAPTNGSIRWIYSAGSRTLVADCRGGRHNLLWRNDGIHAVRPNGQRRWRWNAGYSAATSTPAIDANGVVYALVNPSDAILVALNGSTGALLWSLYLGRDECDLSPAIGPDGRIYVTNGEVPGGYLYCVNPDGTLAWRLYLGAEANSTPCFGSDGAIYVGSARHLNAVNPNGTFRWRFPVFYPVHGSIGIAGSRIFLARGTARSAR